MINLQTAVVYDIETFPNCFTLAMSQLNGDIQAVWEISEFKNDGKDLLTWLKYMQQTQTAMIGFNNIHFDYPVVHSFMCDPLQNADALYKKAMSIINSNERFSNVIWSKDRFIPQIDLFKINHFDNPAKSTSLKALQINMRSPSVVDMPVEVGTHLNRDQIKTLIQYNKHDVEETKRFAKYNQNALEFRLSLINQFDIDVLNWPDTKIGTSLMEQKIGHEICYDYTTGRKVKRQSPRSSVALREIIFPFIKFEHPEFQRVHMYLSEQILKATEIQAMGQTSKRITTKGTFTDLKATIDGIEYVFGVGGIHGSVHSKRFVATEDWLIRDIDVASLYPSIAIVNGMSPEHLGQRFNQVYSELPKERKRWQAEKGKKCVEANTLKLASNGVYGNSNNLYSVFYDPKYMLQTTVNGQLMLAMLAERLLTVPTLSVIQINTDGITYQIHRDNEPTAVAICTEWEKLTKLTLESVNYKRMWIRDVNNYVAENIDGELKLKGAYWSPDPLNYHSTVSNAQPPAWHKDLGNLVATRAAVAYMVHNIPVKTYVQLCRNPYDFMLRAKIKRSDKLLHGEKEIQRNTRYFISNEGQPLIKVAPPRGVEGNYKKANGVSDSEYQRVMTETGGQWDVRVCTKNKSVYKTRKTNLQTGYKVVICNDVTNFDFCKVNFDWYVNEAKKLIVQ